MLKASGVWGLSASTLILWSGGFTVTLSAGVWGRRGGKALGGPGGGRSEGDGGTEMERGTSNMLHDFLKIFKTMIVS